MYTFDDNQRWYEALDTLCHSSAQQILDGISFNEFRGRMVGMIEFLLNTIAIPDAMRTPEMQQSMATLAALEIWNVTPIPENRFRPHKLARPERNAPCLCGSGRKFKQCCAAVDAPDLGITEVHMLGKVLEQFPRRQLANLPLQELDPEALALWRSSGALQWSAGIKTPSKSAAKVKKPLAAADQPDLFS